MFPSYENTTDMNFEIERLFLNFYLVAAIDITIVPELFIVKHYICESKYHVFFPSFANNRIKRGRESNSPPLYPFILSICQK